jgi:hypothetical protein
MTVGRLYFELSPVLNVGLYQGDITPTLHEAHTELIDFLQKWLGVQAFGSK